MNFLNKYYKYIIALVILIGAFALGRFTVPTKTVTVEVEHKVEDTHNNTDTIIVEEVKPDGSKITRTEIKSKTDTKIVSDIKNSTTVQKTSPLNISALAGIDVIHPTGLIFGGHVSKQILGPVSIGIFGLSNGTAGLSVGLSF